MRVHLLVAVVLMFVSAGCGLDDKKCLKGCEVDSETAKAGCEVQGDPVLCKKTADETEAACRKKCSKGQ